MSVEGGRGMSSLGGDVLRAWNNRRIGDGVGVERRLTIAFVVERGVVARLRSVRA